MKRIPRKAVVVIFFLLVLGIVLGYLFPALTLSEGFVALSLLILGLFILSDLQSRFQKRRKEPASSEREIGVLPPTSEQANKSFFFRLAARMATLLRSTPAAVRRNVAYLGRLIWLAGFSLKLQLRHNWRHLISLLMILSLAIGTVTALFVWVDLAPKNALTEGLDKRQFHLIVKRGADALLYTPGVLWETRDYLHEEPLVATSEMVWNTMGLFNVANKSESYDMSYLFEEGDPPPDAIFVTDQDKRQDAFIVNGTYLEQMRTWFRVVNGTFSFENGGILLSKQLHALMEEFLNRTIRVRDLIDLAVAGHPLRPPDVFGPPQLRDFRRLDLGNRTINGIIERRPSTSLRTPGFLEETLGDGLLIDYQEVEESFLRDLERNQGQLICEPKLFVRLNREELFRQGPFALEDQIRALEVRLHGRFANPATLVIFDRTGDLREAVEAFKQIRWMVIFAFAPLVLLPQLLLIVLVVDNSRRRKTIEGMYQLRGATRGQLWALRVAEPAVVGPLAALVGVYLGIELATVIPETVRFAEFKLVHPDVLLTDLNWSITLWLTVAFLGELPYAVFLCGQAIFRPQRLDQGLNSAHQRATGLRRIMPGPVVIFSGLLLATLLMASDGREYVMSHQELFTIYLAALMILWIGFGIASISILKRLLPSLWGTIGGLRGPQMFMTMAFFRDRHGRTASLGVLLTMAFSLIVSAAAYDSTLRVGAQEEAIYLIGSDFKVLTDEIEKEKLGEIIAQFSQIEGVAIAVPFVFMEGDLGAFHLNVIGTNISAYLAAGSWYKSSIPSGMNQGEDYQAILETLAQDATGILISEQLANDAGLGLEEPLTLANLARDWRISLNFTIRGIAQSAPGFGHLATYESSTRGFGKRLGSVIVNFDTLYSLVDVFTVHHFLLQAESRLDKTALRDLAHTIREIPKVRTVYFLPDANLYDQEWYPVGSIAGVFSLDLIVVGLLGLGALPFVLIETVQLRRRELAIFRVFGASWTQTRSAIFRENAIMTIFCLGQGVLVGFLFGWILVTATMHIWSSTRVLPYQFVVPLEIVGFWSLLMAFILLLSVLWPVIRLKASSLGLELRNPYRDIN
ncbi:MAG: ABC transporter permease [Candidatus Heimdallarchaeota archaeon]